MTFYSRVPVTKLAPDLHDAGTHLSIYLSLFIFIYLSLFIYLIIMDSSHNRSTKYYFIRFPFSLASGKEGLLICCCGSRLTSFYILDVEKRVVPWESDKAVKYCRYCFKKFNLIQRRHHCRLCGKVFCSDCCDFINTDSACE